MPATGMMVSFTVGIVVAFLTVHYGIWLVRSMLHGVSRSGGPVIRPLTATYNCSERRLTISGIPGTATAIWGNVYSGHNQPVPERPNEESGVVFKADPNTPTDTLDSSGWPGTGDGEITCAVWIETMSESHFNQDCPSSSSGHGVPKRQPQQQWSSSYQG